GNFEQAEKLLAKDKKWAENNHRVLYDMNRGLVLFMLGEYEKSNEYLNKADFYYEDYRKRLGSEALALVTNPMTKPYKPEDFEVIMVHFYKALNYIGLNNYENALVECRRINIRLHEFNEHYKEGKNKYARDAFAHNLMGIVFQAAGDYNNAFIAYRNALEIYEKEYVELFGTTVPKQLKIDLINAARKMGFGDEVRFYENKFGMKAAEIPANTGELVFFWINGLCPVKSEWGMTFTNMGVKNGAVLFANDELGVSFPIPISARSSREQAAFKNFSVARIAMPKYIERSPMAQKAVLKTSKGDYPLELAENINAIAFQCLKDRMLREAGNSLLRFVTKKALEEVGRSQDDNIGTIISIINSATEKADTRNWQSLPYSISYTRAALPEGEQSLQITQTGSGFNTTNNLNASIKKEKTTFKVFHQLASWK
ncbi:MAG: hypothetical protein LBV41_07475, partial [Cytophagaceae bacterium]|nr:hypothetical protein [Cytophagaceae bacterium]